MYLLATASFYERDNRLVREELLPNGSYGYKEYVSGRWVPYTDGVTVVHVGDRLDDAAAISWVKQYWQQLGQVLTDEEVLIQIQPVSKQPRHILRAQQFDRQFLEQTLFPEAYRIHRMLNSAEGREQLRQELRHRTIVTLFYEPSTRTRLSFELAAVHLGMHVITTENAKEFGSAIKGETEEDTIRVISSYRPDVVVIRHSDDRFVEKIAKYSAVPLINGGEGTTQHPTQALLDLYTIHSEKRKIDGLTVVLGGDLKFGRTVRSLAYLLSKFQDVKLIFVSHESFRIPDGIKDHLRERKIAFRETDSVSSALREADVVYWTRVQKERMDESLREQADRIQAQFTIGPLHLYEMKHDAILMHPLPRVGEIRQAVDHDPRAAYFRQAENGLFVRGALLKHVLLE
ncbi:MAG TPA: aspartate carbamoyltransferase [Patescibacteria group bacterium]